MATTLTPSVSSDKPIVLVLGCSPPAAVTDVGIRMSVEQASADYHDGVEVAPGEVQTITVPTRALEPGERLIIAIDRVGTGEGSFAIDQDGVQVYVSHIGGDAIFVTRIA